MGGLGGLPGAAGREGDALPGYIWRAQAVTLSAEPWALAMSLSYPGLE